jgi:hypothetical protein
MKLRTENKRKAAYNKGFCASGADGITSAFVLLSSAVQADRFL